MSSVYQKEAYAFFDLYYSRVRAFIRTNVQEDWIAEDLTQETFIRAFRKLHTLKDQNRIEPWLFRIAKNLCTDHNRRAQADDMTGRISIESAIIPCASRQDHLVTQQEMSRCVKSHLHLLPEHLKRVLWLFDVDGFTHKEISETLGISVANVKVRLHRARKKMRQILTDNCRFERDDRNVFVCIPHEIQNRSD